MQLEVLDPLTNERVCIEIPLGKNILLIDPYLANLADLVHADGDTVIVRLRHPGWGKGMLDQAIRVIPISSKEY